MSKVDPKDIENLEIIRKGVEEALSESASRYDQKGSLVLDIAPQDWLGAKAHYKNASIETLDIDVDAEVTFHADLTKDNSGLIESGRYDVVICTEVLEHVLDPFSAVEEMYRILKKGGVLVMTTPLNFRIHNPLPDCWRFTEHGIRVLLKNFESVDIQENGTERFLFPVQYKVNAVK